MHAMVMCLGNRLRDSEEDSGPAQWQHGGHGEDVHARRDPEIHHLRQAVQAPGELSVLFPLTSQPENLICSLNFDYNLKSWL